MAKNAAETVYPKGPMHSIPDSREAESPPPRTDATQGYSVEAAKLPLDRQAILDCWTRGLAHSDPGSKFDWYYRRAPEASPKVFFLQHASQEDAAGVAAVWVRWMHCGDMPVSAGIMIDFVVVPEHRTFYPALFLQREVRRLTADTQPLLFGLPNRQSEAILRRVGYKLVGPMKRRVRVLRTADYLARYLPGWLSRVVGPVIDRIRIGMLAVKCRLKSDFRGQWQARADARFDELWKCASLPETLMGVRDSEFLNWRFGDNPLGKYDFFAVCSKSGRLVAYAVCEAKKKSLNVQDFLVAPGVKAVWSSLWMLLACEAYDRGYASLSTQFLGADAIHLQLDKAGLVTREERPFYASASHGWASKLEPRHWYVTAADEDG